MNEENVGDYPRPPRCEPLSHRIRIVRGGEAIVDTHGLESWRVLETFHPPTYYVPPAAIRPGLLRPNRRRTLCEWKGEASYFDVLVGDDTIEAGAWTYRHPTPAFRAIRDHVAFYPAPFVGGGDGDGCFVGAERVIAQPGSFYGGWLTANIRGPVKGAPGTTHW